MQSGGGPPQGVPISRSWPRWIVVMAEVAAVSQMRVHSPHRMHRSGSGRCVKLLSVTPCSAAMRCTASLSGQRASSRSTTLRRTCRTRSLFVGPADGGLDTQ